MNQTPSLQAIRAKKNELLSIAAKYEAMAEKARKQAADYEAAERVWLQLAPSDQDDNIAPRGKTAEELLEERPTAVRKPSGSPAVPEMILEALSAAGRPMTPNELLAYVREKYWPEAQSPDVGSTAWRMAKDGRLVRPSPGFYGLPKGKGSHPDLLSAGQDTRSGVV